MELFSFSHLGSCTSFGPMQALISKQAKKIDTQKAALALKAHTVSPIPRAQKSGWRIMCMIRSEIKPIFVSCQYFAKNNNNNLVSGKQRPSD